MAQPFRSPKIASTFCSLASLYEFTSESRSVASLVVETTQVTINGHPSCHSNYDQLEQAVLDWWKMEVFCYVELSDWYPFRNSRRGDGEFDMGLVMVRSPQNTKNPHFLILITSVALLQFTTHHRLLSKCQLCSLLVLNSKFAAHLLKNVFQDIARREKSVFDKWYYRLQNV